MYCLKLSLLATWWTNDLHYIQKASVWLTLNVVSTRHFNKPANLACIL